MSDRAGSVDLAVVVVDQQDEHDVDGERWGPLAEQVLRAEGATGELNVLFESRAQMAELNATHMGHDAPTDVLAFPLDVGDEPITAGECLLGDVVICPAVAARQAEAHGHPVEDELALLVVHGVLHICGWDHAEPGERAAMQRRERELLDAWAS